MVSRARGGGHVKPKIRVETDVWTLALERVDRLYDRFDQLCVSFSGGKDSTATLHVALEVAERRGRLPLRVVHSDEEAIPMETEEYVRRISRDPRIDLEWYCLPIQHRNACSRMHPWWWPWAPESESLWVRPLPPEGITQLRGFPREPPARRLSWPDTSGLLHPPERGNVCCLLGIRAAESVTRERMVRWTTGPDNYIKPDHQAATSRGNVFKAYPIYDWTAADVWTAPAQFGWDYNRAYDALEMLGVPAAAQRCSPAFGEEPLQKLWTFAEAFPDVWGRMTERVPGVGAAARYSNTELYGFRGTPPKPAGMTWREFILSYIAKHNPEGQEKTAFQVRKWMTVHYGHTADPILPDNPHPATGVSWRRLLMTAMRGDFKDRKQFQPPPVGSPAHDRLVVRYADELAALTASGELADCIHDKENDER